MIDYQTFHQIRHLCDEEHLSAAQIATARTSASTWTMFSTSFNALWLTSRSEYNKKGPKPTSRPLKEELAATYSRGIYKTTTIGKTVFDGRVRNGNGSDHSFMATKNRR